MSKGKRNSILLLILCMLGLFGWWFLEQPKEPSYQGKTIDAWLDEMAESEFDLSAERHGHLRVVFAAMGPSAAPYIIRRIRLSDDSSLNSKYEEILPRLPDWLAKRLPPPKHRFYDVMPSMFALACLGPSFEPQLIALLKDTSPSVRVNAAWALREVYLMYHTDIRNAESSLIDGLLDPNEVVPQAAPTLSDVWNRNRVLCEC